MSEQAKKVRLEGIVHASRYHRRDQGKQFRGAAIECSDGKVWVIDYSEESPYHAYAGRHVVVSGEPFDPDPYGQRLVGWSGSKSVGHFSVSTMRLVDATIESTLSLQAQRLAGLIARFWRRTIGRFV